MVENLVGYAKTDLMIPLIGSTSTSPSDRNDAAAAWCVEVNANQHSEICAVPAERLAVEQPLLGDLPSLRGEFGARPTTRKVDKLSCVRFGSARYSVPCRLIGSTVTVLVHDELLRVIGPVTGEVHAEHALVAPGEVSIDDAHYDHPRPDKPNRTARPRTQTEKDFLALGPIAETFLTGAAAAAGVTKLPSEIAVILDLAAAHGDDAVVVALGRCPVQSVACRRHPLDPRHPRRERRRTHAAAGRRCPDRCGRADSADGPDTIARRLQDPRQGGLVVTATSPPALPTDLTEGLKRLKMAAMRQLAPELLVTAKTQRWSPEEFLRTLVEAEIAARDESNAKAQAQVRWVPRRQDPRRVRRARLVGPDCDVRLPRIAGMDPSGRERLPHRTRRDREVPHPRRAGPAVEAGYRVRYFTAADLVETLYRGLADNSVGKTIDTLLRNDLVLLDELGFAPLDDTGAQLLFRFIAAAYERRSLGVASHWPFESWGWFLPEHTTAVSMLDRLLHHCNTVVTDGDSYRMKQARQNGGTRIKTT